MSTHEVAAYTGWHRSKISRIETGHSAISPVDAVQYLGACGVYRAQAMDLMKLCREAERQMGYWVGRHGEWLEDSLSALIFHESTADPAPTRSGSVHLLRRPRTGPSAAGR